MPEMVVIATRAAVKKAAQTTRQQSAALGENNWSPLGEDALSPVQLPCRERKEVGEVRH